MTDDLRRVQESLRIAIQACTELSLDFAALALAKGRAERERDALARRQTIGFAKRAESLVLLQYALHLRQQGERAPGGNETWARFDRLAEACLRSQPPPEEAGGPWEPQGADGQPVTLHEAVGQALGAASVCWERVSAAGEFDSAQCVRVYDGLMAWLESYSSVRVPENTGKHLAETGGSLATPAFFSHQPQRGSDVEAWLKEYRETHRDNEGRITSARHAIDELLDDYRERADTGTKLLDQIEREKS